MSTSDNTKSAKWVVYLIEGAVLAMALALILVIRNHIYEPALVISGSMEPTLQINDRILVDHRSSLRGTWKRGDIVLFHEPDSWINEGEGEGETPLEEREQLIKRVIGLPGETIEVRTNGVLINGRMPDESYAPATQQGVAPDRFGAPPVTLLLAKDQYFVMGDNRGNSADSRIHGPIAERDIVGRATRVLWPMGRAGALRQPDYK